MVTHTIILYDMPLLVPPDHQPLEEEGPHPQLTLLLLQQMVACIMQTISLTFLFSEMLVQIQRIVEQLSSTYL